MSFRNRTRLGRAGFTLLELLVVIAVIALLAALVGPDVLRNASHARTETARTQIEMLGLALDAYRLDNHVYPSTDQGLSALRTMPVTGIVPHGWRGPYLRRPVPNDPWGRPYVYVAPGQHDPAAYDLYSLGRDGQAGGEGEDADVRSWEDGATR